MSRSATHLAMICLGFLLVDCREKSASHPEPGDLIPRPKGSYTSSMALMVSISDDGRLAAKVTADGKFDLVDLVSKRRLWQRDVHGKCVQAVAVDPSGSHLGYSSDCGELVVEVIATGERTTYAGPRRDQPIRSLAMATGGYPLAFGVCGRGVYVIKAKGEEPVTYRPAGKCDGEFDDVASIALSGGGSFLAAGWACAAETDSPRDIAAPTDAWTASMGSDRATAALVWNVARRSVIGRVLWECNLSYAETSVSPADDMLAVGGTNTELFAFDIRSGARVWGPAAEPGYSVGFLHGGALVVSLLPPTGPADPQIFILSSRDGEAIRTERGGNDIMTRGHFAAGKGDKFLVAHRSGVVDVYRVSADGRQIRKFWEF